MTEQKILEKKKRELEKMVSARQEKENALRDKIQKAEGQKAGAEANMQKAAEADDMMEYKKAKDERDGAIDLIEFCKERLSAIDTPFDASACNAAVAAVKKEFDEIRENAMRELARLFDKSEALCGELIDACDRKRDFCSWVDNDLLRTQNDNVLVSSAELVEIRRLKMDIRGRLDRLFKDVER